MGASVVAKLANRTLKLLRRRGAAMPGGGADRVPGPRCRDGLAGDGYGHHTAEAERTRADRARGRRAWSSTPSTPPRRWPACSRCASGVGSAGGRCSSGRRTTSWPADDLDRRRRLRQRRAGVRPRTRRHGVGWGGHGARVGERRARSRRGPLGHARGRQRLGDRRGTGLGGAEEGSAREPAPEWAPGSVGAWAPARSRDRGAAAFQDQAGSRASRRRPTLLLNPRTSPAPFCLPARQGLRVRPQARPTRRAAGFAARHEGRA